MRTQLRQVPLYIAGVILCLAALQASAQDAATAQARLEQARKTGTEQALRAFIASGPSQEMEAAARQDLCSLRHPSKARSPKVPTYIELEIAYFFADGCEYEGDVQARLLVAYRDLAVKRNYLSEYEAALSQTFPASINRVAQALRDRVPLATPSGSRDDVVVTRKHPLELRISRLDFDRRAGEPSSFRDEDDYINTFGFATIYSSGITLEAVAGSRRMSLSNGHFEVAGAFLVNGRRIYCTEGRVLFESLAAPPAFADGMHCTFDRQVFIREEGRWRLLAPARQ